MLPCDNLVAWAGESVSTLNGRKTAEKNLTLLEHLHGIVNAVLPRPRALTPFLPGDQSPDIDHERVRTTSPNHVGSLVRVRVVEVEVGVNDIAGERRFSFGIELLVQLLDEFDKVAAAHRVGALLAGACLAVDLDIVREELVLVLSPGQDGSSVDVVQKDTLVGPGDAHGQGTGARSQPQEEEGGGTKPPKPGNEPHGERLVKV